MELQEIRDYLIDLIFPNRCPFCSDFIKWDKLCCNDCFNAIEWVHDNEFDAANKHFDISFTATYYSGVSKKAVLNLKSILELGYAKIVAGELASKLYENGYNNADMIVPVPMSKKKMKKVGFNHSEVYADELSRCLKVKKINLLYKNNVNIEQHTINASERLKNVKGMFYIDKNASLSGKTIILCDDVITTGATMNECAKMLREKGAKEIIAVSAAKQHDLN